MLRSHHVRWTWLLIGVVACSGSDDDSGMQRGGGASSAGTGGGASAGTGASGAGAGGAGASGSGASGSGPLGSPPAPPSADNAWRMMGYDSRNDYHNPAETTLAPQNAGMLVEKWRFTVAGYPPGSPAIADSKVFVMATGGTYAIDLASGAELWKRSDLTGTASVAYAEGSVFVHTQGAMVYRLNAADGTTEWGPMKSYELAQCDGTSSPIVAGGKVIVGHSCGVIEVTATSAAAISLARGGAEAFDVATGAKAWTYFTVPESGEDGAMIWSSVAIDEDSGTVYAATGNNYSLQGGDSDAFHAFDLGSGARKWVQQVRADDTWSYNLAIMGPDSDFGANPILAQVGDMRVVAAGNKGASFWALDRDTGAVLWQRDELSSSHNPANGGVLMNGAFDGERFYVVSNQPDPSGMSGGVGGASVLHAIDGATGVDAWTKTFDAIAWGAPSTANGVLAVPIDTRLYVLDAQSGDELAMFDTGGTIAAGAAAIAQGRIVVGSGLQYVFDSTVKNNDQVICYGLP
jgi:outer membrane protein assembly factor BamB